MRTAAVYLKAELGPAAAAPVATYVKTAKQHEADAMIARVRHALLFGGSRSGKTAHNVRLLAARAISARNSRHAIWRQRRNHLMASIWADTFPKVMRLAFPSVRYKTNKVDGVITFPDYGSEIWFGGLDDKERTEKVLGMEFATLYFNEISQIGYGSVTMAWTRLAQSCGLPLLALYDSNPPTKKHWSYLLFEKGVDPETKRELTDAHEYGSLRMNPRDNPHLPPDYIKILQKLPPRERDRFLDGIYGEGVIGAMWDWASFRRPERDTATRRLRLPQMQRVIVSVDPPASSNAKSAEAGIVVCGLGQDGNGYVLEDGSMQGTPDQWGRAAVNLYEHWRADAIVAEKNQGGDMVAHVLRSVSSRVPVLTVHASRGKVLRAEPVASLYHEGKVFHAGDFGELENQMTEFTHDFDVDVMGYSPDRVDSLVHGLTELMLAPQRGGSRMMVHS